MNEQIPIVGTQEQIDRVIEAEERLVQRFPNSEELIRALASFLKANNRPQPDISLIPELNNQNL